MALTKHFLPLGYMQEEELGHPDALRIMRDKQVRQVLDAPSHDE